MQRDGMKFDGNFSTRVCVYSICVSRFFVFARAHVCSVAWLNSVREGIIFSVCVCVCAATECERRRRRRRRRRERERERGGIHYGDLAEVSYSLKVLQENTLRLLKLYTYTGSAL